MPAEMFRPVPAGRRRRWLLPVSCAAHSVALSALFIAPIVADGDLPVPAQAAPSYIEVLPPDLPPAPPPRRPPAPSKQPTSTAVSNPDAAPTVPPNGINPEPAVGPGIDVGFETGSGVGIVGVPAGQAVTSFEPAPEPRKPLKVGGAINAPRKIRDVAPRYPVIAQQARIEGTVTVEAVIGVDGRVQSARSVHPVPFLEDAALEAVRQWVFTPTRLNGEAVSVVMTVTVEFRLR